MTINASHSFAAQHADPALGFRAVPRWFRRTDFWQSLEGSHRAVLDELYQRIASEPVVQKSTGIKLERGQWAISYDALAAASGTTKKQARAGISRAEKAGVIGHTVITKRLPGRTLHLSIFTWLDFDTYDLALMPQGTPPGISLGTSLGIPQGTVIHNGNTHGDDTKDKTLGEELAAVAAPAWAEGSAPHGGTPTGSSSLPNVGKVGVAALAKQPTARRITTTGKSRAARIGVKAKPAGLDDDQMRAVCSSTLAMMGYWTYGPDAVGKPMDAWAGLAPSKTHWAPSSRDLQKPEPDIGVAALSAWVWVQLCQARVKANVPLQIPDFGKLVGTVKSVRGRMTQDDLVGLVNVMTANWGQITAALSWMSSPPQLDELVLANRHVLDLAQRLAAGQTIRTSAPAVSSETETLIQERYAKLF